MDLSRDVQTMIRLSTPFSGGLPTSVRLPSGVVVEAAVGVASLDETILHDNIVAGVTRTLCFDTSQVDGLRTQQNVFWNGKFWGVLQTSLGGYGSTTTAFLGTAF